jgi:ABC-type polysaccharide/polyol phosphate transport system ATPase subunit
VSAAIAFDHVSKHYRGATPYRALRDDLTAAARRAFRSPPERSVVRALDDVSIQIGEGQATGLIGINGAGKTTALKLASRITYPTSGKIRVRGRVGALIEVSTGLHPELSGRENVSLYGRILGLSRRDVRRRFDEIVSFADIGPALEQPVKQFSSGMQVRLGFALAAFLEPDVLLVDEAIAVGDTGFQYRCVERMRELVREGRTLVFVSHDMSAIETLCQRVVLLDHGGISVDGPAQDVVREYLTRVQSDLVREGHVGASGRDLEITNVTLHDESERAVSSAQLGRGITIRLHYRAEHEIERPIFSVGLSDGRVGCFALASMLVDGRSPAKIAGSGYVDCAFESLPLFPRMYEIWASVRGAGGYGDIVDWQRVRYLDVEGSIDAGGQGSVVHSMADAPVLLPYHWGFSTVDD